VVAFGSQGRHSRRKNHDSLGPLLVGRMIPSNRQTVVGWVMDVANAVASRIVAFARPRRWRSNGFENLVRIAHVSIRREVEHDWLGVGAAQQQ
jgi:hypothetical protein